MGRFGAPNQSGANDAMTKHAEAIKGAHGKEIVEACARAAHEVKRAYCIAIDADIPLGWNDVTEEIRESSRDGVSSALNGATPKQSHENWMKFKLEHGWKYGPVEDEAKKEHPCLVEYEALPESQRVKAEMYLMTVRVVARSLCISFERGDLLPPVMATINDSSSVPINRL